MTIWHIQKIHTDDKNFYEVIPYDLFSMMRFTLKMKNGIKQLVKFLVNSRWSEKKAQTVCTRKNM